MTASSPWRRLVALLAVGAALSAFVDARAATTATAAARRPLLQAATRPARRRM